MRPPSPSNRIISLTHLEAQAFLERDLLANLPLLGALRYEPLDDTYGLERMGQLVAVGLVVAGEPNIPEALPTAHLDALDVEALEDLLRAAPWPAELTWSVARRAHLEPLEAHLGRRHTPESGMIYFIAEAGPERPSSLVRPITLADADVLDLSPCSLSPTALRFWLGRGWRLFGAVRDGALVAHALAAYPTGEIEEVAAVFTAPAARRTGLASAVCAAAIADILGRGRRAVYISRKTNHASRRVATGLGLVPLLETWEIG